MTAGQRTLSGHLAALMLVIASLSACATIDPWTDTRIESEVKARLVAERDANLTRLGVVSRERIVYLSGTVESAEQKEKAEAIAKGVPAVKRVVSTLETARESSRSPVAPSK
jgi:osmotically-inducible protein OsmY